MGIRFSCHLCNQPLHVKDFQAGKRGKCPKCQGSFRIPAKDADFSAAVDESVSGVSLAAKAKSAKNVVPKPKLANSPLSAPSATSASTAGKTSSQPKQLSTTSSGEIRLSSEELPTNLASSKAPAVSKSETNAPSGKPPLGKTNPKNLKVEDRPSLNNGAKDTTLSLPASLLPHVDARWFVRPPSGGQYGPATTQVLIDWIREKRVTAESLLWRDGLETWFSARELVPEPFGGALLPVPPPLAEAAKSPSVPDTEILASSNPANKMTIAVKKKKQVKQQWFVLGLLATMAICLLVALIVILMKGT